MLETPDRHHPLRLSAEAYAEENRVVFVTVCTAKRRGLLATADRASLAIEALRCTCANVGMALIAYCVMPDHLHFVVGTLGEGSVPTLVMRFKGRSSRDLRESGIEGAVWERSYWDRHARKEDDLTKMVEYVLANPVRRGLCAAAEEWPYAGYLGLPW